MNCQLSVNKVNKQSEDTAKSLNSFYWCQVGNDPKLTNSEIHDITQVDMFSQQVVEINRWESSRQMISISQLKTKNYTISLYIL